MKTFNVLSSIFYQRRFRLICDRVERVSVSISCDSGMFTARWAQSNDGLLIRIDRGLFKMDDYRLS